ncbi:hypothetical protein JCM10295v2_006208 [Rhodotorula toruloides]
MLKLPNELLELIFGDVYRHRALAVPLCRALLPLHDKLLTSRYGKVVLAGAEMVERFTDAAVKGDGPHGVPLTEDQMTTTDIDAFFAHLPNLRKLAITYYQLVGTFIDYVKRTDAPMPHLEDLALSAPGGASFVVEVLRALTALKRLKLSLACSPTDHKTRRHSRRSSPLAALQHFQIDLQGNNVDGVVYLLNAAPYLRVLKMENYVKSEASDALLSAASKLARVSEVGLYGEKSWAWKAPKQLKAFKSLARLTLGTGCAARDKPTYQLFRRLPLEYLRLGRRTVVSDAHMLALVSGPDKHPSLATLELDNIYAQCDDIRGRSDWAEYGVCEDWLRNGYRVPDWTKTFSRQGCQRLIEAAKSEGIELFGDSIEAVDIEEEIWESKQDVEGYLERKAKRARWREYMWDRYGECSDDEW